MAEGKCYNRCVKAHKFRAEPARARATGVNRQPEAALRSKNILLPLTDLAAGVRVKVLSGAFWEFNGQVETLLQGDCTQLLLEFMGQTTRVDISKIEPERSEI